MAIKARPYIIILLSYFVKQIVIISSPPPQLSRHTKAVKTKSTHFRFIRITYHIQSTPSCNQKPQRIAEYTFAVNAIQLLYNHEDHRFNDKTYKDLCHSDAIQTSCYELDVNTSPLSNAFETTPKLFANTRVIVAQTIAKTPLVVTRG